MTPTTDQGSAFRRKHLSFLLGRQLETMTAFKAAVGSTPGRVHPNVVRATPFFVGRGPSRRIGTVVNTYATSLRVVSDAENREIEKLFFDENSILLPARLSCASCADARVKCFARRDGVTYVCAVNGANGERYEDERSVHEWVNHWRESAAYDYSGSESEWLADLEEVIAAARATISGTCASGPGASGAKFAHGSGPGEGGGSLTTEKELNDETSGLQRPPSTNGMNAKGDDSDAPPRKRRHVSQDMRELRPAPRRSLDSASQRSVSGQSHHRSVSSTSHDPNANLPSPAATSTRSPMSPFDPDHSYHHPPMGGYSHGQQPYQQTSTGGGHPVPGPRSRSASYTIPPPRTYGNLHPQPHPHSAHSYPQASGHTHPHMQHARHPSGGSRASSQQPPLHAPHPGPPLNLPSPRHHSGPLSASRSHFAAPLATSTSSKGHHSQPNTPRATSPSALDGDVKPQGDLAYYYTLQGHLDSSITLIRAHHAAVAALAVGLDELERRKAELQEEQRRLKIEIRDRENEVRRMREEMLVLHNQHAGDVPRFWQSGGGSGPAGAGIGSGNGVGSSKSSTKSNGNGNGS